jgi:hypothetical protein
LWPRPPSTSPRSFNDKLRDECLNEEIFANLAEAQAVIERWRLDYNHVRPHSAHGGLTPEAVRLNPTVGAGDQLSIPRALIMIEGPPGDRSLRATSLADIVDKGALTVRMGYAHPTPAVRLLPTPGGDVGANRPGRLGGGRNLT